LIYYVYNTFTDWSLPGVRDFSESKTQQRKFTLTTKQQYIKVITSNLVDSAVHGQKSVHFD